MAGILVAVVNGSMAMFSIKEAIQCGYNTGVMSLVLMKSIQM